MTFVIHSYLLLGGYVYFRYTYKLVRRHCFKTKHNMSEIVSFDSGTGYSIEIINCRLICKGTHENLPLYEAVGGKVTAIAIVKEPAIESNARLVPSENILVGPVMIPDLKIFRDKGPNNRKEDCFWYFSAGTIRKLQESFEGQIKIGH